MPWLTVELGIVDMDVIALPALAVRVVDHISDTVVLPEPGQNNCLVLDLKINSSASSVKALVFIPINISECGATTLSRDHLDCPEPLADPAQLSFELRWQA